MRNTNKKGFTIVELVIVVAVIAILAAVLIPTFSGIIRKANISSDTVIAREINTILQAENAIEKIESFDDVIEVLYSNGFYLANLNTKTSGGFFVWESQNNQILLVDAKDDFNVLYPESYEPKGESWHLVCPDKDLLAGLDLTGINVIRAVSSTESLQEFIADGGEIYLDESVVLDATNIISVANKDAHVMINLGESSISSGNDVLPTAPFRVTAGSLTLNGGSISGAGEYTNENGTFKATIQTGSSNSTDASVVNILGTSITNHAASDGSTIRAYRTELNLSNVTLDATKTCVYVANASEAVLDNVTATSTGNAVIFVTHYAADKSMLEGLKTTATINSGVYTNKAPAEYGDYRNSAISVWNGAEVVINGGTFISENGNVFHIDGTGGTITINGGTFSQNPTGLANVTVNGTVVDNGNGTWTVK